MFNFKVLANVVSETTLAANANFGEDLDDVKAKAAKARDAAEKTQADGDKAKADARRIEKDQRMQNYNICSAMEQKRLPKSRLGQIFYVFNPFNGPSCLEIYYPGPSRPTH
jgi:hypothetical protein